MEVLKKQTGFTLMEIIIVMTLMAILAGLAVTRWPSSVNVNAQAQQLAADIRYTQSLAMTHGQRYRLTLTLPNSYAISTTAGTAVANTVTGGNTTTLGSGITFGTITNLPNSLIAFDGRGSPYTNASATTALASTATINLTWGSSTRQIQITPNGQISVQ